MHYLYTGRLFLYQTTRRALSLATFVDTSHFIWAELLTNTRRVSPSEMQMSLALQSIRFHLPFCANALVIKINFQGVSVSSGENADESVSLSLSIRGDSDLNGMVFWKQFSNDCALYFCPLCAPPPVPLNSERMRPDFRFSAAVAARSGGAPRVRMTITRSTWHTRK